MDYNKLSVAPKSSLTQGNHTSHPHGWGLCWRGIYSCANTHPAVYLGAYGGGPLIDVASCCWCGSMMLTLQQLPMMSHGCCGSGGRSRRHLPATWHWPWGMGGARPHAILIADVAVGHLVMPMCIICHVAPPCGCMWGIIYIETCFCVRDTMWASQSPQYALQCHADVASWLMCIFYSQNMLVSCSGGCAKISCIDLTLFFRYEFGV